ncbi:prolipoprotein diacylglyceryl transferase [Solwaraspora sp. WMMB335]|uniref:prolipoprotein diacylglyceryl transferase n=1 Tax=Solwaraspora sp. WMMB335 TaxID=3404118 RepID=UPI003B93096C
MSTGTGVPGSRSATVACAPVTLAAIPSPATAVWQLGPIPIRAYALCIVAGIVVACAVTEYRLRQRGARPWAVLDIAIWAVPFGILGARLYHVISSPQGYFGANGNPIEAFYIWQGGLGIWGAVAGGAVGAWLAARQLGIPLTVVADALAPGLPLAQAVGRFGNWFNNELYGGPTTLPWGLQVHQMDPVNPGQALRGPDGEPVLEPGLYHPTFLYEAVWNVGVAAVVIWAERRWKLGVGRAFALYVMAYTAGRFWIEMMRTDPATEFVGIRVNVFTSVLVFLGALVYLLRVHGPQQFLIPVDAAGQPLPPAEAPTATGAPAPAEAPTATGAPAPAEAPTATGAPAPAEAPTPAADGQAQPAPAADAEPAGGVSQVDVSGKPAPSSEPAGYRPVTEQQFREYERTGALPAAVTGDDAADPEPVSAAADAVPEADAATDSGTAADPVAVADTDHKTDR